MKPEIEYRPKRKSAKPRLALTVHRALSVGQKVAPPVPQLDMRPPGQLPEWTVAVTDAVAELARRRALKAAQMKRYRAKRKVRELRG